jgi:hypothetical protein
MVMNNELNSNSNLPSDHIRKTEAYKFLETAYSAGISIIIEGAPGSGKTSLLQTLINSTEDNQSTIFLTRFFEVDTPKITQIKGDDAFWLIHQARRMNPFRIVMDDLVINQEAMESMVSGALTGTQFISTGCINSSKPAFSETDPLSSRYTAHPYELRVHVALKQNNDTKPEFNILSVSQMTYQKVSIGKDSRQYFYAATSNHLLFEGDKKVADPTRTMRRKIEFSQRREISKNESTSSLKNDPETKGNSASTLVSISPKERAKLLEHGAVLREHFQSQSETLRESFREIEKLLAKL